MKKHISLLLTVCVLLTSLLTLSSCFLHQCEFSDEWTSDEEYHWHICADEGCEEISDKEEHTYDSGEITVKPTQEEDGVMTYTCSKCGSKKEEVAVFAGLSKEEWDEAFSEENFSNFTYHERAIAKYSGIQSISTVVYKFTETKVKATVTTGSSTSSETASGIQAATAKKNLIKSLQDMLKYDIFEYDSENKVYNLTGTMIIEGVGSATEAHLKFENDKPKELVYTCTVYSGGIPVSCKSTITFTDFGATVID